MTNYKRILYGNATYLISYFLAIISIYIIPPLLSTLATALAGNNIDDTTIAGIIWVGLIIIWVISMIIAPIALIIIGLQEETQKETLEKGNLISMVGAILWSLFTILIIYFTWYWIPTLAGMITSAATFDGTSDYLLLTVLFYTSITSMIIMNTIVIPAYIIIKNREKQ